MIFKLEIQLGNDAMVTGEDVAEALRRVVTDLENEHEWRDAVRIFSAPSGGYPGTIKADGYRIRDRNGATVGHWRLK